jgi:hypothetical protein
MDLVSMFRCKECKVRMFERDCAGHLERHGIPIRQLTPAQILTHFDRGPVTAIARPGDGMKPLHYHGKKKAPKPAAADEEDVN